MRGGLKLAGQAIKSRRSRRRAAGRKVIFPYLEQNLAAVRNKRVKQPLAIGRQITSTSSPTLRVSRSEYSAPVRDSIGYADNFVDVNAGDELYFPALAAHAGEYQYYAFRGLTIKYNAIQPATEAGQVAIGVVPTWDALIRITTWDELVALSQTRVTNAWQDMVYAVQPNNLNTQVKEFKVVTPMSLIDYEDPLQTQGFIVYAVRGSPANNTKQIGTLTVAYDACLMKPQLNPLSSSTNIWVGATSALTTHLGSDNFATILTSGTSTQPVFLITTPYRHKLLVFAYAATAGTFAGTATVANFAGTTATALAGTGLSADAAVRLALVVPDGTGPAQFTVSFPSSTQAWSGFRIMIRAVGQSTFWEDL